MRIRDDLPAVYRRLLPAFFDRVVEAETEATCADCAMCDKSPAKSVEAPYFRPDLKCCTFYPSLANYLVGGVLADTSPELSEGRAALTQRIQGRSAVTPRGVEVPAALKMQFEASMESAFGRTGAMACPYLDQARGLCKVWRFREGVCSTYFCRHVNGASGKDFWVTLRSYLKQLEQGLSSFAILELAPELLSPPADGIQLSREDLEGQPTDARTYQGQWGAWFGKEAEFYTRCHALISGLGPEDLERVTGVAGRQSLRDLEGRYESMMQPRVPDTLRFAPKKIAAAGDAVTLVGYSPYHPQEVGREDLKSLFYFDGITPTAAVRAKLQAEGLADLDEELIATLFKLRLLVAP